MRTVPLAITIVLLGFAPAVRAQAPDTTVLTQLLRTELMKHLPDPISESTPGWGHQKDVLVGLKWHREGKLLPRAEPQRAMRNDGHWQKMRVQAIDAPKTLGLGILKVQSPAPGVTTFETHVGLDVRLFYEQQLWKSGVRLYAGESRAKCRVAVRTVCELTTRTETKPGSIVPTVILRVRVTEAEFFYANLVVEHTAGLDGPAAAKVGEIIINTVKQIKPDLEKDLLAKANAAVVKAADTKEVRVELDKLLAFQIPKIAPGK